MEMGSTGTDPGAEQQRLQQDAVKHLRRWARLSSWDAWLTLIALGLPLLAFLVIVVVVAVVLLLD